MSDDYTRLDLKIDVFDQYAQSARALTQLRPPQLIEAILQEFRELEFLSHSPDQYSLHHVNDGRLLQDDYTLEQQVENDAHLRLVEIEAELPEGTKRPSQHIYLREQSSGLAYKLHWLPAIVGRPDSNQPFDDRVAVNLESYPNGLRVSRRHFKISEKDEQFQIERMSPNPTSLTHNGERKELSDKPKSLQDGDLIHLDRSRITFKFIVRPEIALTPEANMDETDITEIDESGATAH